METRKLFRILLAATALSVGAGASAQWVEYNGKDLNLNPAPIREGSTIMLPARATADAIGATIKHDGRNSRFTWRSNTIEYSPGDNDYYLNGRRRSLGGRSFERRSILYVPSNLFEDLTNDALKVSRNRRGDWGDWDKDRDRDRNPDRNPRWPDRDDRNNVGDTVYFNGRALRFARGEEPIRSGSTLLVALRSTASQIGLRVERPDNGARIILRSGRNEVVYDRGRNYYRLNGRQVNLPAASRDRGDVYYVPMEVLDAAVDGKLTTRR